MTHPRRGKVAAPATGGAPASRRCKGEKNTAAGEKAEVRSEKASHVLLSHYSLLTSQRSAIATVLAAAILLSAPVAVAEGAAQPDAQGTASSTNLAEAIDTALRRTVKLYGAGIAREHGYGTGIIVSPDGHVITVLSLLLEATNLRVVTHNGYVYRATVAYRDDYRQLALLKMARHPENPDTDTPLRDQMAPLQVDPFPLGDTSGSQAGDWIFTVGNPFKVAEGDEPLSVMKGIVSGRSHLDALRGANPFPFRGEVLLVDAITSGPGSGGSAVIDLEGRLVGLAGRDVRSRLTNTLLNYIYPVEELKTFLADAQSDETTAARPVSISAGPGYHGIQLSRIAYRRELPFVHRVARGSPAADAGVRPDDLIISANGTAISHSRVFNELCERLRPEDELSLVVKRGEQLIPIRFQLTEPPE
jgi:serine protease Do